jgi:hypothetical protein
VPAVKSQRRRQVAARERPQRHPVADQPDAYWITLHEWGLNVQVPMLAVLYGVGLSVIHI